MRYIVAGQVLSSVIYGLISINLSLTNLIRALLQVELPKPMVANPSFFPFLSVKE